MKGTYTTVCRKNFCLWKAPWAL